MRNDKLYKNLQEHMTATPEMTKFLLNLGLNSKYLTSFGFNAAMPKVSETEKQVLEIGSPDILNDIYNGHIDFDAYLGRGGLKLTEEEQTFMDGPVEDLCAMLDDYAIAEQAKDGVPNIPEKAWAFIKEKGFLGLEVSKEEGGLGFSSYAHALIVEKISTRSSAGAVCVMVPNSLGPAKLIKYYGTEAQKEEFIGKLAIGEMIPCFALTGEVNGSDAVNTASEGIVERAEDGSLRITIKNVNNRYITLAPVADVIGLAVNVKDPDGLLPKGVKPGLTAILVKRDQNGLIIGDYHKPGVAFPNGPIRSAEEGITVDTEKCVIGGVQKIGQGWPMLVEQLSIGRGISLPALSVGGAKKALWIASSYAKVRQQFGLNLEKFEGVQEKIGQMAGRTYLADAVFQSTLRTIADGGVPSVLTAIAKYHLTETLRKNVEDAMDVMGGKGIMEGPRNMLGQMRKAIPVAITVEGANILTRTFMIFGQGSVRCNTPLVQAMAAAERGDKKALHNAIANQLLPNMFENAERAVALSREKPELTVEGYKRQVERLGVVFNVAANTSAFTIGGDLKKKQALSARMGDMMSYIYMTLSTLEKFQNEGSQKDDEPLMNWACQYALEQAEEAAFEFIRNYRDYVDELDGNMGKMSLLQKAGHIVSAPMMRDLADMIEQAAFPEGRKLLKPLDRLTRDAASVAIEPGPARDRLAEHVYLPSKHKESVNEPLSALQRAYSLGLDKDIQSAQKKIRLAIKSGTLESNDPVLAATKGIVTEDQRDRMLAWKHEVTQVIRVDHFPAPRVA